MKNCRPIVKKAPDERLTLRPVTPEVAGSSPVTRAIYL